MTAGLDGPGWNTSTTLVGLSRGEPELIDSLLQIQLDNIESSGLDPKTHALTRIAALIAIDAAPVSVPVRFRPTIVEGQDASPLGEI